MKILIVSDIHGGFNQMKQVLENAPFFDYLFILGDLLSSNIDNSKNLAQLLNPYSQKIICVRGNNDFHHFELFDFIIDQDYAMVPVEHQMFFLTHGHLYQPYNASSFKYDVFLSGHTHIPSMKEENGKLYINPGSITLPMGEFGGTYIFYQDGVFQLKELDGHIIKEIKKNSD